VRIAWAEDPGVVVSMLSLDMASAYDAVSHERLVHNLRKNKLPEWVAGFAWSFVNDRTTQLLFDGKKAPKQATRTGIPQGSPLSPILFLFFAADLLLTLN
jgi:hypothetical protein